MHVTLTTIFIASVAQKLLMVKLVVDNVSVDGFHIHTVPVTGKMLIEIPYTLYLIPYHHFNIKEKKNIKANQQWISL